MFLVFLFFLIFFIFRVKDVSDSSLFVPYSFYHIFPFFNFSSFFRWHFHTISSKLEKLFCLIFSRFSVVLLVLENFFVLESFRKWKWGKSAWDVAKLLIGFRINYWVTYQSEFLNKFGAKCSIFWTMKFNHKFQFFLIKDFMIYDKKAGEKRTKKIWRKIIHMRLPAIFHPWQKKRNYQPFLRSFFFSFLLLEQTHMASCWYQKVLNHTWF